MFSSELHDDARSTSRVVRSDFGIRYVTVEMPADDGRFAGSMVDDVLRSTTGGLRDVAATLGHHLVGGVGGSSDWAFFAGVDVGEGDVTCCVAGPHRVHLIQRGAIVASTHEHTVQYDGPPPDWPPMSADELRSHANVVVRSIGGAATRPPAVTRWSVQGACQVVVVSADFYGAQTPVMYALSVGARLGNPSTITGSCALLIRG